MNMYRIFVNLYVELGGTQIGAIVTLTHGNPLHLVDVLVNRGKQRFKVHGKRPSVLLQGVRF